jgi:hypothetical protein
MRLAPAEEPIHLMGISITHMAVMEFEMKKSTNNRPTCSTLAAQKRVNSGRIKRDQLVYDSPLELACHAANIGA